MFWRYNYLGALWAFLMLLLFILPGENFGETSIPYVDKVIHVILFSVLFFLLSVGFIKQSRYSMLRSKTNVKVFVFCVLYGATLEFLQSSTGFGRTLEIGDLLANSAGTGIGWLVFIAIYGMRPYH